MSQYIGFMGSEPFASASDLPVEEMVEYAMITIFGDYSGERELYSVSEVNTRVRELFGAEVDAAQTKFYNAEEGGCELLGRGGMWFYTWTSPAKQDAATGRYTIDVNFYTDALRTLRGAHCALHPGAQRQPLPVYQCRRAVTGKIFRC